MTKLIEITFKITNSGIMNFVRVYKSEEGSHIPLWIKCGLSGKQIIWSNPIEKGIGTYNKAIITLEKQNPTATGGTAFVPSAKILYSKDILSHTNGAVGDYVDNSGHRWKAELLGSRRVEVVSLMQAANVVA